MLNSIGQNVRKFRNAKSWTQEQLADIAKVTARTIQRIESGDVPPSAETLLALAGAFDVSVDDLRRAPEEWDRLAEQAQKFFKEFDDRYEVVKLERISRASNLTRLFSGVNALLCEHVDLSNDAEEDAFHNLQVLLRDCFDFWGDFPESHRDVERDLQKLIDELADLALVAAAGAHTRRLRSVANNVPVTFDVLYVMVSRGTDPKLHVAIDKKAQVQLG